MEFIVTKLPIHFILPAFPFKSQNREKTIGDLPDFGEVLALKRLNDLCSTIAEVYDYGAKVTICSDGRIFNDILNVPDENVSAYARHIKIIIKDNALTNLSTYSLDDVPDAKGGFEQKRDWIIGKHAPTLESIYAEFKQPGPSGFDAMNLFNGIKHFCYDDQRVLRPGLSNKKIKKLCSALSLHVIQRSRAWSELLNITFINPVRLSIHPQSLSSTKLGIILVPSIDRWRTPWHSVPLYDGEGYSLVRRQEAEQQQSKLIVMENGYFCYVAPGLGTPPPNV